MHVPRRSQPDLSDALPTSARKSLSFRQQLQPPSSRSLLPPPQVTVAAAATASASSFSILSDSTNRVAAPGPFVDVPADLLSGTPLPDEAAIFRAMHGWDGVGGRHHRADLEDGDGDVDDEENSNRSGLWILKRANPVFSSDDEYESPPKRSRGCGSGGTVSAQALPRCRLGRRTRTTATAPETTPSPGRTWRQWSGRPIGPPRPPPSACRSGTCLKKPRRGREPCWTGACASPPPRPRGGGSRGTCSQGFCPSANDAPALLTHPFRQESLSLPRRKLLSLLGGEDKKCSRCIVY